MSVLRVNVGCGEYPLAGYVNIDELGLGAEIAARVPPLPFAKGEVDEVWACHFFEHLDPAEGRRFLAECRRVLKPGGLLGLVVPDTREILRRYVDGDGSSVEYPAGTFNFLADLDDVGALFLYGTNQPSAHRWSYDAATLRRALEGAGFTVTDEIDRHADPRIAVGAWYQCGWEAVAA